MSRYTTVSPWSDQVPSVTISAPGSSYSSAESRTYSDATPGDRSPKPYDIVY